MNLNDGVLDDLEDAPIIDGSLIIPPAGGELPMADPITLEVDLDNKQEQDILPETDVAALPAMDIALKLVKDGQEKVISLKAVENEILAQESMSRSSAEYVSASFESIFSGPVKLSEFTISPSKTNLDYVKKHMKQTIALEEAAVVTNFQLLLEQPLADAKDMYSRILVSYLPTIYAQISDMRGLVLKFAEGIGNNKNSVFPNGENTFINIGTADFSAIKVTSVPNEAACGNLGALQKILKKPHLTAFVHAVMDGKTFPEAISTEYHPTYMGVPTTVQDLLKFYSGDVRSYIEHLESVCTAQFQYLNDLAENVKREEAAPDPTSGISLSGGMPSIQDAFAILDRAMNLIHQLSLLNYNAKGFMTYISTL